MTPHKKDDIDELARVYNVSSKLEVDVVQFEKSWPEVANAFLENECIIRKVQRVETRKGDMYCIELWGEPTEKLQKAIHRLLPGQWTQWDDTQLKDRKVLFDTFGVFLRKDRNDD